MGNQRDTVRQQQFKYTYLFGALCPQRGDAVGLLLPVANTETMNIHLEHIASHVPKGKHAVVVLDRAGWHTTKKLATFDSLTLLPLPPFSPELNPCEQIWKHLRRKHLSNRCFKDDEVLMKSCSDAWNDFTDDPKFVTSLCSRDWIKM